MGIVKVAVAFSVVASVAGQQLAAMEPARRVALWTATESLIAGGTAPARVLPPEAPARSRILQAAPPAASRSSDLDAEILPPDRGGQFETSIEIGGQRLTALVDTGATYVALSAEAADRLGIRPAPSDFKYVTSTANGLARNAKVTLPSLRLGQIELRDVVAMVAERGTLGVNLLGMSFLSRLSTVRMDRGRMLLAQ